MRGQAEIAYELPAAAQGFHPDRADVSAVELRQDLFLEAAVVDIEYIDWQLTRIPCEIHVQHALQDVRALVSGKPDIADFASFSSR